MTTENFEKVLRAMIRRKPFKPFTIELHNGDRFEIDHPEATVMRQGVAIFLAPGPVPIYFDHEGVVQIIDAPASTAPGREGAAHAE
jgi:hypothetical protein